MVKERIIAESCNLFLVHGIKTTMDDIAKHLGISKRTIYENFKDKNELLTVCTVHMYAEANNHAKEIFAKASNVLEASLEHFFRQSAHTHQLGMKYIMDLRKYFPEVYKNCLLKCHDERLKHSIAFVEKGIREGVFRKEINATFTAFIFSAEAALTLSEQFRKFNDEINSNENFSEFFLLENIVVTYARGIVTPMGLEILEKYLAANDRISI